MKFDILSILRKSVEKIKFSLYLTRIAGNLQKHVCTFLHLADFFSMRNVSDKTCREQIHFMLNKYFIIFSESHAVYVIVRKNTLQPDRPQMTIHV
jgi:hypothetical protein